MSRENAEIVRRLYDAAAQRDTPAVLALYSPDVEFDYSRGPGADMLGHSIYRGHDGLRGFFRDWSEAFDHFRSDCAELIDAGDSVVSVEVVNARGRASGATVELNQSGVWTIRDGKVIRVVWFSSRDEALEAAQLGN